MRGKYILIKIENLNKTSKQRWRQRFIVWMLIWLISCILIKNTLVDSPHTQGTWRWRNGQCHYVGRWKSGRRTAAVSNEPYQKTAQRYKEIYSLFLYRSSFHMWGSYPVAESNMYHIGFEHKRRWYVQGCSGLVVFFSGYVQPTHCSPRVKPYWPHKCDLFSQLPSHQTTTWQPKTL